MRLFKFIIASTTFFACSDTKPEENTDLDGDGYTEDCDDNNPNIYPGAIEICDGLDNDGDGAVAGPVPGGLVPGGPVPGGPRMSAAASSGAQIRPSGTSSFSAARRSSPPSAFAMGVSTLLGHTQFTRI